MMRYWFMMLIAGAVGALLLTTAQPQSLAKDKDKKDGKTAKM